MSARVALPPRAASAAAAGRLSSAKYVPAIGTRGRMPAPISRRAGAAAASRDSSGQVLKCGGGRSFTPVHSRS